MHRALGCLLFALIAVLAVPATGLAATVERNSTSGLLSIIDTDGANDDILVERTSMSDIISDHSPTATLFNNAGECTFDAAADVVTCPRSSSFAVDLGDGNDHFRADSVNAPISVAGGSGNDVLSTGPANDVLAGGAGNDTLDGKGGTDEYFGETGDDIIEARDATAERISCGAGNDEAHNDFVDIIAECERGIDGDRDGFSTAVDCNDGNPAIHPGAQEIFDNGVDENCDGRDNPNLDVDGDGFPRPVDCDDGNRNIRPNVPEIKGNKVDENCDKRAEPFADLGAVVANQWAFGPAFSRLLKLVVHNAPKGAHVRFTCKGSSCPFRRAKRRTSTGLLRPIVLHRPFRGVLVRPGTKLTVTITAPQTIGRTYSYVVKRAAPPQTTISCRAPGARRSRSC